MVCVILCGFIEFFMKVVFNWDIHLIPDSDSDFSLIPSYIETLLIFIYLCTKIKEIDWDKLDKMD